MGRERNNHLAGAVKAGFVLFNPSFIYLFVGGSVKCVVFSSIRWDNNGTYLFGLLEELIHPYKALGMVPY